MMGVGSSFNFGQTAQTTLNEEVEMYVQAKVTNCVFNDATYDEPIDGAHLIVRGSNGRWGCLMSAGPDFLMRRGIVPYTYEEALLYIKRVGEPGDWLEF